MSAKLVACETGDKQISKEEGMSEKNNVEQWLAIRKEAGLKIDPETAEVDWCYAQTLDHMVCIQTCLRNVSKLAVNTSLGLREARYGSTSTISRKKRAMLYGSGININWRSLRGLQNERPTKIRAGGRHEALV